MPLRLNGIRKNGDNDALINWLLNEGIQGCDSVYMAEDKKFLHMRREIPDLISGSRIGWLVFTVELNNEEHRLEILDIDIVLENDTPSRIRFLNLREGSSEANEYYDVEMADEGGRLAIETVNRHTVPGNLLDTERDVRISMFPFRLSVYKSIDDYNREVGFAKPIRAGGSDMLVRGFSETFCMPSGNPRGEEDDDSSSLVIGTVKSFLYVIAEFGEVRLPFIVAKVDTAAGIVPVAMSRDVFDLSDLAPGRVVVMETIVKADVADEIAFKR